MLTCESAQALIVREADGAATPVERGQLEHHVTGCPRCRSMREANLIVKPVLVQRTDAEVPASFAARVMAGVRQDRPADWLSVVDWRRWTEWMLPVAAGLALLALLGGNTAPGTAGEASGETVAGDASVSDAVLGDAATHPIDMSSDELLATMLGAASASAQGGGASDGR